MAKPAAARKATMAADPCALLAALDGRGAKQAANQLDGLGRTLLSLASISETSKRAPPEQSAQCVKILISHGADPNQTDKKGQNAIHWAARFGSPLSLEALVQGGANVQSRLVESGKTPLHLAALSQSIRVVLALSRSGADFMALDVHGARPIDLVTNAYTIALATTNHHRASSKLLELKTFLQGFTSLHEAAEIASATCRPAVLLARKSSL